MIFVVGKYFFFKLIHAHGPTLLQLAIELPCSFEYARRVATSTHQADPSSLSNGQRVLLTTTGALGAGQTAPTTEPIPPHPSHTFAPPIISVTIREPNPTLTRGVIPLLAIDLFARCYSCGQCKKKMGNKMGPTGLIDLHSPSNIIAPIGPADKYPEW